MSHVCGTPAIDPVLIPYIAATDDDEANQAAEVIFATYTIPIVDRIIGFKTRSVRADAQAARDVTGDTLVHLWIRLRKCRDGEEPIRCWSTYVKETTHNTWRAYLRRKRPSWHAFKNRLRYVIRWDDTLALWQDDNGEWLCGLRGWRSRPPAESAPWQGIVNGSRPLDVGSSGNDRSAEGLAAQLRSLFGQADGPVDLDTVVAILVRLQGPEHRFVSDTDPNVAQSLVAGGAPIDEAIIHRETLERLWTEIRALPSNQLVALLLNLRGDDGLPALELLFLAGVAQIAEIAQALSLSPDDFARLLPHLPLDDATIASMLGKTGQQVINLRKSARDRLRRRRKAA